MIIVRPVLPVRGSVSWFNKAMLGLANTRAFSRVLGNPWPASFTLDRPNTSQSQEPILPSVVGPDACSRWLSMHTTELEILPLVQKSYLGAASVFDHPHQIDTAI